MSRIVLIILAITLFSIYLFLNPYHPCLNDQKIAIPSVHNKFTSCIPSANTYDYNDDISLQKLSVPIHVYFPKTSSKVPLIIISHGAGGIFKFHHDYKDMFISHGYAVAIIDHFSPRGIAIDFNFVNVSEAMMLSDFTSTAKYLMSNYKSRLQKNIGYIGWSKGGIASLSLKHNIIYEKYMPKDIELSFVAGMYTYCGVGYEKYNYSNIPVLIISGRSDEVTPSKYCEDLYNKNKNKEIIEYHEIKNAYHGFDNHAFLLGAYLPWQPILIDSEKCRIMVNEFLETTNVLKNSTLTTPSSRQDFINACTQRGAYVKYNYESSKISKILVMDFIKKYMSVNN